jgi:hypothetical protein
LNALNASPEVESPTFFQSLPLTVLAKTPPLRRALAQLAHR